MNDKVYANIFITTKTMTRFATVLDTVAGASFIRLDHLLHCLRENIEPLSKDVPVRNTSAKLVSLLGSMELTVQLGQSVEKVKFFFADKLATAVILGCDYCDLYICGIRPRIKHFRLYVLTCISVVIKFT